MMRSSVTAEMVLQRLEFDSASGVFRRRDKINQHEAGQAAGTVVDSGARQIKLLGADFMDYDLVWLVTHGSLPTGRIVHVDGDRSNCRPENLVDVSRRTELTADLLRMLLGYNRDTGEFRWKATFGSRAKVGSAAGAVGPNGYLVISVLGKLHYAHRLAWLHANGEMPPAGMVIDHVNCIRDDNRLENLRLVSLTGNAENKRQAMSHNKSSGLLGVAWSEPMNKFEALIVSAGKRTRLGYFENKHDAHAAYVRAKRGLHKACTL